MNGQIKACFVVLFVALACTKTSAQVNPVTITCSHSIVDATGAVYVVPVPCPSPSATVTPTIPPSTPTPKPSPTPTIAPTEAPLIIYYTNSKPGTAYPVPIKLPQLAHKTAIAEVNGSALAAGGTIISFSGSWNIEAGDFIPGVNPIGSNGAHDWDALQGLQASAAVSLIPGKTVTVAGTQNGKTLAYYVCTPICTKTSVADIGSLGPGVSAYIGAAGPGIRVCSSCHIFGVQVSSPMTDDQVQAYALAAPADPYGPNPTPSPTPAPSVSPTTGPPATPTAVPTSAGAWPAPGWVPYPGSVLTAVVGPNPTYTSNSAAIVRAVYGGEPNSIGHLQTEAGLSQPSGADYSQPLYFGNASDPAYKVTCSMYGGSCPASGVTVHIPRGAYPAGGTDHHIAIRDLSSGKDVMLWLAPIPNGKGGSYSVGWGTVISSNGNGLDAVGGTASGLSALWALRATDVQHNAINHAIIVQINGESQDGYVYPAVGWDNGYFHSDPWPMMGAHFWLDVPPPYNNCPQASTSILTAYNKYGFYFADNGGVSIPEPNYESDEPYTFQGGASAWKPVIQSLGGNYPGTVNIAMSSCGIDMSTHLHVLNPPAGASGDFFYRFSRNHPRKDNRP